MSYQNYKRKLPPWMLKNKAKKETNTDLKNEPTQKISKITKYTLKPVEFNGKIHYLKEHDEIENKIKELLMTINAQADNLKTEEKEERFVPVAFDMEWPFEPVTNESFKTAVIQICLNIEEVFILQVSKLKRIPDALIAFLHNKHVKLHGLNIRKDLRKLSIDFPETKAERLESRCVDLQEFYNTTFGVSKNWSLAGLCAHIFDLRMDKTLRVSKWNAELSRDQQLYAAIDVFIGQKIFHHISAVDKENQQKYQGIFGKSGDHISAVKSDARLEKCDSEEFQYRFGNMEDMQLVEYNGKIHYLTDFYQVAEEFEKLNQQINKMAETLEDGVKIPVAFDMEWSFDFKNGQGKTAVLQICFNLKEVYVIHMSRVQRIPASLSIFLKNENTVLHGVNIKNDFRKLERDFPCMKADPLIEKCVDLRTYYNDVFNCSEKWSLATLCAHTLKFKMDKSRNVRMSKWDYTCLSKKQLQYASIDVYVGQKIYMHIHAREKENASKYSGFFGVFDELAAEESKLSNLDDDINALMNS